MAVILRILAGAGLVIMGIWSAAPAQARIVEYQLTIEQKLLTITGRPAEGMTINGAIPGPTLRFKEGDTARIRVRNAMAADTSIHWHGVLVPPGMDGVPYISFAPIKPGATFTYEFPIRQSGTYWYHSHSGLQEQSGVYGAIVIDPQTESGKADRDYVVLLSDWTDEDPHSVNRTLRRGSEWYALQKGSAQSILGAGRLGMLGHYYKRELQRMPPMDIADVAYDRFLANGTPDLRLQAEPRQTVRLRIIDGSATTYFYLQFAGGPMTIVSADGQQVMPVQENRFLIAVAETYDIIVQVPEAGAYELRATAHDGSGFTSVWIGSGQPHAAPDVPRPNLYQSMGDPGLAQIFAFTPAGAMGMSDDAVRAGRFDRPGMGPMGSMDMGPMAPMSQDGAMAAMPTVDEGHPPVGPVPSQERQMDMDHGSAAAKQGMPPMATMPMDDKVHSENGSAPSQENQMDMDHGSAAAKQEMPPMAGSISGSQHAASSMQKHGADFGLLTADVSAAENLAADGMDAQRPLAPYAKLRSAKTTALATDKSVRVIRLTLDGDMQRYVWSINNQTLSESDTILIRAGEVVRFIMINRTMMHHPMHLHGHFFRVINGQGDHAPLKHTVDVAPMSTTVIEFDANEVGDWFFHCHLLYHMKNGMARVIHYEDYGIDRDLQALRPDLLKDPWYFWGQADMLSNMTEGALMLSNTRNMIKAQWEIGWENVEDTQWEEVITWDRFIHRFFSVFAGVDHLDEGDGDDETRGVLGFHYLLPFNLESRVWVDTDGGARVNLEKEFELTPRIALTGEAQYDAHDGWESSAVLSYVVRKNVSVVGRWNSDYGAGAGIRIRF